MQGEGGVPDWVKSRALDQAGIGITITDPNKEDNPIVYANQGFYDITGYERGDVVGRNCRFLQGEDTDEGTVAEIRRSINAEEEVSVEILNYRADGTRFWNELEITPVYDDDGELTHFFGFQRDVTERRRRRRQLEHERSRLEEFAGLLSHDVRNPLSVAMGSVEMARESGDVGELEAAERAHDRIESVVENTLRYVREGDVVDADLVTVDVAELAAAAAEETCAVEVEVESDVEIQCDREAVTRLFENLLRNAGEHEASTVRVGALDGQEGFYVEDDGEGIPDSEREKVWEHGYSTGGTTGLGLSIVRAIAEAHGWTISVAEGSEDGARFEVRFGSS